MVEGDMVMMAIHSTQSTQCLHMKPQTLAPQIHRPRANNHTYQSMQIQTHKPHSHGLFCLIPRRPVYFGLRMCMHTHACLWRTVILMRFHLHARDPFVFIIIIRLEEADLLELMARVMPLCLGIKNNFTTSTFVMSPLHRTRNIIKGNSALCLNKTAFPERRIYRAVK